MDFFNNCMKNKPDSLRFWQDYLIFSKQYNREEQSAVFYEKWDELLPKLLNLNKSEEFSSYQSEDFMSNQVEESLLDQYHLLPFYEHLFYFLMQDYERYGCFQIEKLFYTLELSTFRTFMVKNIIRSPHFNIRFVTKNRKLCIILQDYLKAMFMFNNPMFKKIIRESIITRNNIDSMFRDYNVAKFRAYNVLMIEDYKFECNKESHQNYNKDHLCDELIYARLESWEYSRFVKNNALPEIYSLDTKINKLYTLVFNTEIDWSTRFPLSVISDEENNKILKCLIHYDLEQFYNLCKFSNIVPNYEIQQELKKIFQNFTFLPLIPQLERCELAYKIIEMLQFKPKSLSKLTIEAESILNDYKFKSLEEFERVFSLCVCLENRDPFISLTTIIQKHVFKFSDNPLNFLAKYKKYWTDHIEYITIDHLSKFAKNSDEVEFQDFIHFVMVICGKDDEINRNIPSIFYSFEFIYRLEYRFFEKYYNWGYHHWIDTIANLYPSFMGTLCKNTLCTIKTDAKRFKFVINSFPRLAVSLAFEQVEFFNHYNVYELVGYCRKYNEKCLLNLIRNHVYLSNLKKECHKIFESSQNKIKSFFNFISTIPYACRVFSLFLYTIEEDRLKTFISNIKNGWTYNYNVCDFLIKFPILHHLLDLPDQVLERSDSQCYICLELCLKPLRLECNHKFCEYCIMYLLTINPESKCPTCRANINTLAFDENDCFFKFSEKI